MTPLIMTQIRFFVWGLLLNAAVTTAVIGQEQTFPKFNCAATPPDGWLTTTSMPSQPGFIVHFSNADKTQLFFIAIDAKSKSLGPIDDHAIAEMERAAKDNGTAKILWIKIIEVAGLKCFEQLSMCTINGRNVSDLSRIIPTNQGCYHLRAMRTDGDANMSGELLNCLANFRFLSPPAPANPAKDYSASYRAGYFEGKLKAMIATVVLIVALIIRGRRQRKKQTPPALPNSSTPNPSPVPTTPSNTVSRLRLPPRTPLRAIKKTNGSTSTSVPSESKPVVDIYFNCPDCGQSFVTESTSAGSELPCSRCSKTVIVPEKSTAPVPVEATAPAAAKKPEVPAEQALLPISTAPVEPPPAPAVPVPPVPTTPIEPPQAATVPPIPTAPVEPPPAVPVPPAPAALVEPPPATPVPTAPTMPVEPPPAKPVPPPIPAAVPASTSKPLVRLADIASPTQSPADQWCVRAQLLARQLWGAKSAEPFLAKTIEAFLQAMPVSTLNRPGESASLSQDILSRFRKPTFHGVVTQMAELLERWMHYQASRAQQPGTGADQVSFSISPEPGSFAVSFGMNYLLRGSVGHKRVACWVVRSGDNLFLFTGKLPPGVTTSSNRPVEAEPPPPVLTISSLPRETILGLPAPAGIDAEQAQLMRQLILSFCEAHFVKSDNRLSAEVYDQIHQRREIARKVLPEVIQVTPPSREKRMLQQLFRDL